MKNTNEINKISKNLSLRLSPQRKYGPEITQCPLCFCCPCKCCYSCHCCPCTCFLHSPTKQKCSNIFVTGVSGLNSLKNKYIKKSSDIINSTNFESYQNSKKQNIFGGDNKYNSYEQEQFNDFLIKLMEIEGEIEQMKIELSSNQDFNCEDAFRIFELDGKDFLDKEDLKYGLNLLNIYPTEHDLKLLIKRFDLQKIGVITFEDFFDLIVPFEKMFRTNVEKRLPRSCCPCKCLDAFSLGTINSLKSLFNFIIRAENQINNIRRNMGTLRIKLRDIFGLIDKTKKGFFNNNDFLFYLQNEEITYNDKNSDLLFIRLDKNRNGKIDYREVEDELQTLY